MDESNPPSYLSSTDCASIGYGIHPYWTYGVDIGVYHQESSAVGEEWERDGAVDVGTLCGVDLYEYVEEDMSKEMEKLGLPATFGSAPVKKKYGKKRGPRGGAEACAACGEGGLSSDKGCSGRNEPPQVVSRPQEEFNRKYWFQRHKLFSKFSKGILMDEEGWYSVTPEKVAAEIAERCRCEVIVDAFCGSGGNAIQFAFTCERVIAIDVDPKKIEHARHNAKIYEVEDRIEFIVGDFMRLAPGLRADVVFLAPPWGGPDYIHRDSYDIETMMPLNGLRVYEKASMIATSIAFYVPRNTHPLQLMNLNPKCVIEKNFVNSKLKALTAYYGSLVDYI